MPAAEPRSTSTSTGPCSRDGHGVPHQTVKYSHPGRNASGKYRPDRTFETIIQASCGPRESSSQYAAALTTYRQAKLITIASSTDTAKRGYVSGCFGA